MNDFTLTPQALKRLNSAPAEVRLFNGCFNVASVKAVFSRYEVELRVQVTHPSLAWQCGNKSSVELLYWKSNEGTRLSLPTELEPLVQKLRKAATMTNEMAQRLSYENATAFASALQELGVLN